MRNNDFLSPHMRNRTRESISAVGMAGSMRMALPSITARRKRPKRDGYKYDELDEHDDEFLHDNEQCSL